VPNILLGNNVLRNRNNNSLFSSVMTSNKNEQTKKEIPVESIPISIEEKYLGALCTKIKSILLKLKLGKILLTNSFERQIDIILNDITLEILAIKSKWRIFIYIYIYVYIIFNNNNNNNNNNKIVLGNFIVASLTEDKYGIIQRDIQPILECLLQCLLDVETFIKNPPITLSPEEIIKYNKEMPVKLDIIISSKNNNKQ